MQSLERRAGAVDALKRPGIAVRPTQLARNHRHSRRLGSGSQKELLQARYSKLASRLELAEQTLQLQDLRVGGVMVCADKDRDLLGGRALDQAGADGRPHSGEPLGGGG